MSEQQKSYKIPKDKIKEIITESISLANGIWVDELDCSKSFARKPTDKTIQEVFKIGLKGKSTFWNFIYRPAFYEGEKPYFDVGCRTMGIGLDYFLWIKLNVENGEKLIKKYKLKSII